MIHRLARARAAMADVDADALLVSVGSDLPYLTGYRAMASERLTMLALTQDSALLVVPQLEATRVLHREGFTVRPWAETEDAVALVVGAVGSPKQVLVGTETWSRFTLELQDRLPGSRFGDAGPLMAGLRILKHDEEIGALRRAAAAADDVVEALADERFTNRTEVELSRLVTDLVVTLGHDAAGFAIVASGPNAASPHHEPADRVMAQGDTVVVDFGGTVDGYCSDTTRTFTIGDPSSEVLRAYRALRAAQEAAVATVQPGVAAEEIDRTARRVIGESGYGDWFIHRTGHGIGMDVHEHPYLVEGNSEALREGMTFSVEPGIYPPGRWGMRIEDIVVVTADGSERLNESSRELVVVE